MPVIGIRPAPALTPGAVRRTQPKTLALRPSYPLASPAAALQARGYSSTQVDRVLPAAQQRGAGNTPRPGRSQAHVAHARAASHANQMTLQSGRAPMGLVHGPGVSTGSHSSSGGSHTGHH